jgi:hypothetical protein
MGELGWMWGEGVVGEGRRRRRDFKVEDGGRYRYIGWGEVSKERVEIFKSVQISER